MPSPTSSGRQPRRLASPNLICNLGLALNLLLVSEIACFAWLLEPRPEQHGYLVLFKQYVLLCAGAALALGWLHARWRVGPLARFRRLLAEGAPTSEFDPVDVRHSLTLYRPLAWYSFFSWALPSLAWPLVVYLHLGPELVELALTLAVAGVSVAVMVAATVYAAIYALTHYWIAPVLLAHGSLEQVKPVRLVRAWYFVVAGTVITGILEPLNIVILLRQGDVTVGVVIYSVVVMLIVAGATTLANLLAISKTSGNLAGLMARVRRGDLDVQADIFNLDTFGQLASDFNAMVEGLRQREHLRETFGRYVSRQVAEKILSEEVKLGGELRTATVLFSDIRGFTKMSEQLTPPEVVSFLNSYLDIMVDCVFNHGGVLDKFIGDAIMAVWGVPVGKGDPAADAEAAVACALEMSERLEQLNGERRADDKPPIEIGIGLHTGPVVAGNIGSEKFMEYTVIGDTVNVTSRLEGMTKKLGRRVLVSEATAQLLAEPAALEEIDEMPVRGREGAVRVFGVASGTPPTPSRHG